MFNVAPCHCDCFYRKKTKCAFAFSKSVPKCTCNCRYFSFRRSGVHPPLHVK